MHVKFYGTRGSVPVSNPDSVRYGGNTTCLRVLSPCIPEEHLLVIDAGSGIVPLGQEIARKGEAIKTVELLFTHYHHDHTQGLPLCPLTFNERIQIHCLGPVEHKVGPRQMLKQILRPPYFPVKFAQVASHFQCLSVEHPAGMAITSHPEGGFRLVPIDELRRAELAQPSQIQIGRGHYSLRECLVVLMYRSNHPERTIAYRFEERPTGKVFVFLTDHENLDGFPQAMLYHLLGADFLVMDSQYKRETYDTKKAGYGHGTPDYCVRVAKTVAAAKLGLTHHDPESTDADVDQILAEAKAKAEEIGYPGEIIALSDYLSVEV